MRITKTGTYVMTGIAVAMFVLLSLIFDTLTRFELDGPWFSQANERGEASFIDGVFWTYLFIGLIVAAGVIQARRLPDAGVGIALGRDTDTPGQIQDPSWWKLVLGNSYLSLLWLPLRFYLGREWLSAGHHKIQSDAWMDGGQGLAGYWTGALTGGPEGSSRAAYGWYSDFLQYMLDHEWYTWFAKVIAVGEFLVGVGLLVGALVGIAAFFGTLMNVSFMLAGTVSSNPVMFALTVFLVLGWKVAGWWGLDRYLLPMLGTPWYRGVALGGKHDTTQPPAGTQKFA
jgi:thiosulfate dehydrogenase [quinone] large subunit